jgi:hypothetical protein
MCIKPSPAAIETVSTESKGLRRLTPKSNLATMLAEQVGTEREAWIIQVVVGARRQAPARARALRGTERPKKNVQNHDSRGVSSLFGPLGALATAVHGVDERRHEGDAQRPQAWLAVEPEDSKAFMVSFSVQLIARAGLKERPARKRE